MDGVAGGPWSGYPGAAAPSAAEIYYRQASLAALQGHNPYGMYAAAAALNNLPKPPPAGAAGFPMFATPPNTSSSIPTTSPHPHHQFAYPPGLARPTAHLPGQHPLHSNNDRRSTSPPTSASESTPSADVGPARHPEASSHESVPTTPSSHHSDRQSPSVLPTSNRVADDDSDSDIEV